MLLGTVLPSVDDRDLPEGLLRFLARRSALGDARVKAEDEEQFGAGWRQHRDLNTLPLPRHGAQAREIGVQETQATIPQSWIKRP